MCPKLYFLLCTSVCWVFLGWDKILLMFIHSSQYHINVTSSLLRTGSLLQCNLVTVFQDRNGAAVFSVMELACSIEVQELTQKIQNFGARLVQHPHLQSKFVVCRRALLCWMWDLESILMLKVSLVWYRASTCPMMHNECSSSHMLQETAEMSLQNGILQ